MVILFIEEEVEVEEIEEEENGYREDQWRDPMEILVEEMVMITIQCSKCGDTTHGEGFTCPAKKYQCNACHKFGHFMSQCFQKKQYNQQKYRQPKAHQIQIEE